MPRTSLYKRRNNYAATGQPEAAFLAVLPASISTSAFPPNSSSRECDHINIPCWDPGVLSRLQSVKAPQSALRGEDAEADGSFLCVAHVIIYTACSFDHHLADTRLCSSKVSRSSCLYFHPQLDQKNNEQTNKRTKSLPTSFPCP